jgi:ATP-dependent Clp protease protease subunit
MNHPTMSRLLRMQALNRTAPREYRIENAASDEPTIYLYDIIGYDWWSGGGVTAKQFAKDINAITAPVIHLRINSPGGDVFEGRAMVAAMKSHASRIVVHVDGLAASAASFIAMHADEVVMTEGSFMMIHNAWTFAAGDRNSLRETADLLEKMDGEIANDYGKRTSASAEQVREWMDAETWMTASESIERGFADRLDEKTDSKAKAKAWNVAAYDSAPTALAVDEEPAPDAEPQPDTDHEAEHAERARRLALIEKTFA